MVLGSRSTIEEKYALLHLFMAGAEGEEGAPGGDGSGQTPPPESKDQTPPPEPDPNNKDDSNSDDDPDIFDKEYVEKLRRENAKYRTERNDLQSKLDEFEKAQMSELERAQTEAQEAKAQAEAAQAELRKTKLQSALLSHATGFHDPHDALLLIPQDQISVDDDGNPNTNSVKAAIDRLAKEKPHLLKSNNPGSGDGGAGRDGGTNLGDAKEAEYEKRYAEMGGVKKPKRSTPS